MLGSLKELFRERVVPRIAQPSTEAREHGLLLAAVALLFEVVRADATVKDGERTVMRTAVQSVFGLAREEAEELVDLAEQASRSAGSLYEFTSLVDQEHPGERLKPAGKDGSNNADRDKYEPDDIHYSMNIVFFSISQNYSIFFIIIFIKSKDYICGRHRSILSCYILSTWFSWRNKNDKDT